MFQKTPVTEIEFQVSQVIGRLEEAVIGKTSNSCDTFISQSSKADEGLPTQTKSVLQQLEVITK